MEEYDIVIIGSGPGGYVAAIRAGQLGFSVACVEKDPYLGGTCLNVGCIPSKALLQSTELFATLQTKGKDHGIDASSLSMNFSQMMKRKEGVITGFRSGIAGLFKKNKVTPISGFASFVNPQEITVANNQETKNIRAKYFIIATGSVPTQLPFMPFDEKKILSSTGALALDYIPEQMILVGGGVIGVELGSVYQRLGTKVTCVEFLDRICPAMDKEVSKAFQKILENQGMSFSLSTKVMSADLSDRVTLQAQCQSETKTFNGDVCLVAVGRTPYTKDLGLDKIGIELDRGFIPINDCFQTSHPHIFAIGDVAGGPMLAHKASEEGIATVELIANKQAHISYICIPNVVYTDPEVASVGFTEESLKEKSIPIKKFSFPFKANSRARAAMHDEGFVKMLIHGKSHHILGVHIIGPHAGELIQECALAMHCKLKAEDIAYASHAHPTFTEAVKEAALGCLGSAIHI